MNPKHFSPNFNFVQKLRSEGREEVGEKAEVWKIKPEKRSKCEMKQELS